ncbi:ribonuclease H-like domain-containing protein [Tanacetum coccineum]
MAYSSSSSDSEVSNNSNCSKSCLKTVETLKSQYDQLHKDFNKSELMVLAYKTGLESVEEKLEVYKANESIYSQDIKVLKFEIECKDLAIRKLKKKLEISQKEKDSIQFNVDKFENASEPIVENSEAKANKAKPKANRKNNGAPIIEDWVSDSEEENVSQSKIKKKTAKPSFVKINFVKANKQTKLIGKLLNKLSTIGKTLTFLKVDCNYQRVVKPVWNNVKRVNHHNFAKKTHPCPKKNMIPRAVLMKSGLVSVNTARQVNAAHSKTTMNAARPLLYLSKTTHSTVKRPIHKNTTFKNSNFNQRVNTVRDKNVNTARPKAVVNAVKGNNINIQVSDGLDPQKKLIFLSDVQGNPQMDLQDKGVIDSECSRHITGNMSYLLDYEEIDGGYVAFRGNPKGGKIIGKSTKDEASGILKSFITGIENLVDHKVKVIRCDNGTEFKNREMNLTLIKAVRTMLADSKLPTTFWGEAVNTACYVQNRVLVVKPHNKTPYELFHGRTPTLSFMRPFGCLVTILNTIDHLDLKSSQDDGSKPSFDDEKKVDEDPRNDSECIDQEKDDNVNSTNNVNVPSTNEVNAVGGKTSIKLPDDPNMPALEDISIFDLSRDYEDVAAEADMNNLDTIIQVSPILTTKIHKDHPLNKVIGDLKSTTQTRNMSNC